MFPKDDTQSSHHRRYCLFGSESHLNGLCTREKWVDHKDQKSSTKGRTSNPCTREKENSEKVDDPGDVGPSSPVLTES